MQSNSTIRVMSAVMRNKWALFVALRVCTEEYHIIEEALAWGSFLLLQEVQYLNPTKLHNLHATLLSVRMLRYVSMSTILQKPLSFPTFHIFASKSIQPLARVRHLRPQKRVQTCSSLNLLPWRNPLATQMSAPFFDGGGGKHNQTLPRPVGSFELRSLHSGNPEGFPQAPGPA
jgi:hypothetical protein